MIAAIASQGPDYAGEGRERMRVHPIGGGPKDDVKGGDKVYHRGGGIVYHRHDEEELNWEPGEIRSGAGGRSSGVPD